MPAMYAHNFGCRSSGIAFRRFFVLNTMWKWFLTYEPGLCRPFGTRDFSLPYPGTAVPGYRLFRPFGTRFVNLFLPGTRHCRAGLQAVPSLRDSIHKPHPTRHPALPCRATGCLVPSGLGISLFRFPALPRRARACAVPCGTWFSIAENCPALLTCWATFSRPPETDVVPCKGQGAPIGWSGFFVIAEFAESLQPRVSSPGDAHSPHPPRQTGSRSRRDTSGHAPATR